MRTPSLQGYPQLISLAVHELRTPASVVGGYLRMLQRDADAPLSDRQRKMVEEAEKSCARIVALVAELSDIGKLDGGVLVLTQQPLDAFALAGEVATNVHEAEDRNVRLTIRGEPSGGSLPGDAVRLRAAFAAVFRSILRETSGPCTVVVERRRDRVEGQECAIFVIAEEARVHAAYEASRGPFDDKRGGMGLALPLARRVIEGHGGHIWSPAGDESLARGSAVVALPIA